MKIINSNYITGMGSQFIPVTSSNLSAVRYDASTHLLDIRFKGGRTYRYFRVPEHIYQDLMRAPSHGKYFYHHIKGRYQYQRL